jgi:hypothetical protein
MLDELGLAETHNASGGTRFMRRFWKLVMGLGRWGVWQVPRSARW